MQQNTPRVRYTLFRRLLFPYSGEEALSLKQSLRVLLAWMVLLPLLMALCTIGITVLFSYPLEKMALFFVFTFLSAFLIFGCLGTLVIWVNNSSARFHRQRKASNDQNPHGGRYGS